MCILTCCFSQVLCAAGCSVRHEAGLQRLAQRLAPSDSRVPLLLLLLLLLMDVDGDVRVCDSATVMALMIVIRIVMMMMMVVVVVLVLVVVMFDNMCAFSLLSELFCFHTWSQARVLFPFLHLHHLAPAMRVIT